MTASEDGAEHNCHNQQPIDHCQWSCSGQ